MKKVEDDAVKAVFFIVYVISRPQRIQRECNYQPKALSLCLCLVFKILVSQGYIPFDEVNDAITMC